MSNCYFDSKITLIDKDLKFIIDDLLIYIFNSDQVILGSLNGNLTLNFKNIKNKFINNGKININIDEKNLNILKTDFEVNEIGLISSKFKYYEKEGELIFKSNNVLKIENLKEFQSKFQLNSQKLIKPKKIIFDLEKNINTGEFSIFNIYINEINPEKKSDKFYSIKNIQSIKSLLRDILT